jgi:biotin carboxyl carrier protein
MSEQFLNSLSTQRTIKDVSTQRSEMMQDIVSDRPGFLIRSGNAFFLLILILIAAACWLIKYPDTIDASATLTSINAPKPVLSLIGGKLVKLTIKESDKVTMGEVLGYLESTANHEEVLNLRSGIDTIQVLLDQGYAGKISRHFPVSDQLGELQTSYQSFSQAFLSFTNYLNEGFYNKKRRMILRDKINLEKLYSYLVEQSRLQEEDLSIVQKTFEANQSLKNDNVISDFDYRLEQSKLINKKLTLPQIKSALISNENLQIEKEKELMELDNTISQQNLVFQQALNTFRSQIDEWKRRYVLTAPISGKVAFASFVQEHQQLQANQIICYINPENSQYFAEIVIPQPNFGKVKLQQKVLLRFESYPFQEFGSILGKIDFISRVPDANGYRARVTLSNGLTSTYNKQIQYRDGLSANAQIITNDLRLLERFYYNFLKQIQKN